MAFLGRKEKAFLIGDQDIQRMTYFLGENLTSMLLWPLRVFLFLFFFSFILNFP